MYIYIDESGILAEGQGDFFILGAYLTHDRFSAARCIKYARQKLGKKSKNTEEIKFNNSKDSTITYLLKSLGCSDFCVYYIAYKKHGNIADIKKFERELIVTLLKSIPYESDISEIYIDNFMNSSIERDRYINELKQVTGLEKIRIVNSNACPGVQVADFIAGTLHRYFCNMNDAYGQKYYTILKENCAKIEQVTPSLLRPFTIQ